MALFTFQLDNVNRITIKEKSKWNKITQCWAINCKDYQCYSKTLSFHRFFFSKTGDYSQKCKSIVRFEVGCSIILCTC